VRVRVKWERDVLVGEGVRIVVAGIDVIGNVDIGFVACIMLAIDAWEEIHS